MLEEKDFAEPTEQPTAEVNEQTSTQNTTENPSDNLQEDEPVIEKMDNTDELSVLKAELAEQKDKYLRLFAEFDNFKKRNAKERLELFKTAGQDIIRELLPILDDFQRADKAFEQDKNAENYVQGVQLIQEKFQKTLQNKGLKAMESVGATFDVEKHEAIAEIPASTEEQKGKVIDEVQRGYTLNDVIIRYAKVVVGK